MSVLSKALKKVESNVSNVTENIVGKDVKEGIEKVGATAVGAGVGFVVGGPGGAIAGAANVARQVTRKGDNDISFGNLLDKSFFGGVAGGAADVFLANQGGLIGGTGKVLKGAGSYLAKGAGAAYSSLKEGKGAFYPLLHGGITAGKRTVGQIGEFTDPLENFFKNASDAFHAGMGKPPSGGKAQGGGGGAGGQAEGGVGVGGQGGQAGGGTGVGGKGGEALGGAGGLGGIGGGAELNPTFNPSTSPTIAPSFNLATGSVDFKALIAIGAIIGTVFLLRRKNA